MSSETTPATKVIDPYEFMQIIHNPDDSLTRLGADPHTSPSTDPTLSVLTKDIPINPSKNTFIRLFLPQQATTHNHHAIKLPLIVFFHGGGFLFQSAASTIHHDLCTQMTCTVGALVASVDYRLAPEHRLPAAYDDAMEALRWIRSSHESWLLRHADFNNCYLMGGSAGGNLAYHAGLRATSELHHDLEPLKIRGLILRQPFFGGIQRTASELRLENDPFIPLICVDLVWSLALPKGADRDHEYSHQTAGSGLDEKLDRIKELGWRVLVSVTGEDPLSDRQKEVAALMEARGVRVTVDFQEKGTHGIEYFDPSNCAAKELMELVKDFIFPFSNNM